MTPHEPLVRWGWILDHADEIWQRLIEHVVLTVLAVGIGLALSFALALLIRRQRRLRDPILRLAGVLNRLRRFQSELSPGFVFGLNRTHHPREGRWIDEAQERTLRNLGVASSGDLKAAGKRLAALRKSARKLDEKLGALAGKVGSGS